MNEGIITEPAPAEQAPGELQLFVSLEGVHVEFPDGYWDDPAMDVLARDHRTMREHAVRNLALAIAAGLQRALGERRPTSGLVGPDGRPL